jgi:hypothetical protein
MGTRSWGATDWASYAATSATAKAAPTATSYFTARGMDPDLDPAKFTIRESRHSDANPASTPIILGLDLTGSMGPIAKDIAQNGLGVLIKEIFDRKPVSDPHIMFAGIGDVECDPIALQASQFEADATMIKQLEKLCLTQSGGGGNRWESYNGPWHLAAYHTDCDAWKDGRKGFIFTFGDETPPPDFDSHWLKKIYGRENEPVATNAQLLEELHDKYHVFHLIIQQGSHMGGDFHTVPKHLTHAGEQCLQLWQELLGQHALLINDYHKLGEIIVSTMQIVAGTDKDKVIKSWSGDTAVAVLNATRGLVGKKDIAGGGSLVRF